MGYLNTKLTIYFKDYNDLYDYNLLKLDKKSYNSDSNNIKEALTKCKISKLKVTLTLLSIPLIFLSFYFLHMLIFIYIFKLDPNKYVIPTGPLHHYMFYIYLFYILFFTIFYLISRRNITIKKSTYLKILTIVSVIIWFAFNIAFVIFLIRIATGPSFN